MFAAILALLLLPIMDVSRSRGMQFRPLSKIAFFIFVANFLLLMQLGSKHVESPFIEFGQTSTVLYFLYFTVVIYSVTKIENTFVDIKNTTLLNSYAAKLYDYAERLNPYVYSVVEIELYIIDTVFPEYVVFKGLDILDLYNSNTNNPKVKYLEYRINRWTFKDIVVYSSVQIRRDGVDMTVWSYKPDE